VEVLNARLAAAEAAVAGGERQCSYLQTEKVSELQAPGHTQAEAAVGTALVRDYRRWQHSELRLHLVSPMHLNLCEPVPHGEGVGISCDRMRAFASVRMLWVPCHHQFQLGSHTVCLCCGRRLCCGSGT